MFCDLVGSTSLAAKLDPENWRDLVNAYLDEASKAVTALGGRVLNKLGDGLMALFECPQARENDAERAVRAALPARSPGFNARNAGGARHSLPFASASSRGRWCGSRLREISPKRRDASGPLRPSSMARPSN
jgi:class 3 adenylate cyclase